MEIPPRFEGQPPVNPDSHSRLHAGVWEGARGLAEDIGYYGQWMRDRAFERIGHLYPKVRLPDSEGGGESTVIAWLWARTVRSPDPAWDGHVPLVRSWIVRKATKHKPVVWVEPMVDRETRIISYRIREGDEPSGGTVERRGGTCIATGVPMGFEYIRQQGRDGLMGKHLIAVVAEGNRGRVYVNPVDQPLVMEPDWVPRIPLPERTLGFRVQQYGMTEWADLFTDRQLLALCTFSDLLREARAVVEEHARARGMVSDGSGLRQGGSGATAYADAVATYLGFAIDKLANRNNALVRWGPAVQCPLDLFSRHAIPMVWDFAEANPLCSSSGSWFAMVRSITGTFRSKGWPLAKGTSVAAIAQRDAVARMGEVPSPVICTDPPYYDNISYADLSDFFYVWLRRNLSDVWPDETATRLTPKTEELIANPYRAGSKQAAREHFESGMSQVLCQIGQSQNPDFPATIFYSYKQQETKQGETAATGWETFLQGLVDEGLQITATWPIRTETRSRMVAMGTAALASSIVIACRPRSDQAPLATRREFLDALHADLPERVRLLQDQAIAPVDMAQSAIGPGMEVFSRYARVLEADGTRMRVRAALSLINEVLEEVLSAEETEFDPDTRWAITWYEQNGHRRAPFGEAETLSKAKITSVEGVVRAGIAESVAGQVRLVTRDELAPDWDPLSDKRLTVWEVTQYLIVSLGSSETEAGKLLGKVGGGMGDRARRLAYRLYQIAEGKSRTADAVAYNTLIEAWPHIARHAAAPTPVAQTFEGM